MLNQHITPLPVNTGRAFLGINQGFQAMYVYFTTLERELRELAVAVGSMFHQYLKQFPSQEQLAQMGPEKRAEMEMMGDDIAHWLDRMIIEIRKWKKKIDYYHFEKQLTVSILLVVSKVYTDQVDTASPKP